MRIHITLIGGQPTPVYHAIKAIEPEHIVFIYSQDTERQLNCIKNEIATPCEEIILPPTDVAKIKQQAEELATRFANDEVSVNISGGLKSWSFWFGTVFHKCDNATVVYIDQNNILWNYKTLQWDKVPNIDILTQFRLHGNPIDGNYTDYKEFNEADRKAIALIENIRASNHDIFNQLTLLTDKQKKRPKNERTGHFATTDNQSYLEWERATEKGEAEKVKINILRRNGTYLTKEICSPHVIELMFNAGWFEYKVATLLEKWDKAREIFLNCHFPFVKGTDKNEVDIIVNTGIKVLFVECKTKISSSNDIDKFTSVIKKYGGTGSKGLFITDAPMKDLDKKKCEDNGILHFSLKEVNTSFTTEQALTMLLNNDIERINTK